MDRNYNRLILQLCSGFNCYQANNLDIFDQKKDKVKHGRNGILTSIPGSYRLVSEPKKVGTVVFEEIDNYTGITTLNEFDNHDLGFSRIKKFPYTQLGLEVKIFYSTLDDFEDFLNVGYCDIRNLLLIYKKNLNQPHLIAVNSKFDSGKRKRILDEYLKPNFET